LRIVVHKLVDSKHQSMLDHNDFSILLVDIHQGKTFDQSAVSDMCCRVRHIDIL
jgi:hypothetical protein